MAVTVVYQGHWYELGFVDWRWEEGIVIVYDTHDHWFAEIPISEIEAL